jgi:hypothetical protein
VKKKLEIRKIIEAIADVTNYKLALKIQIQRVLTSMRGPKGSRRP